MKWLEVGAISTTMEWVVADSMEMGYVRVMMEGGSIKNGGINFAGLHTKKSFNHFPLNS